MEHNRMTSKTFWIDWKTLAKGRRLSLALRQSRPGQGRIAQSREESETTARFLTKQRPPTSKIEKCQLYLSLSLSLSRGPRWAGQRWRKRERQCTRHLPSSPPSKKKTHTHKLTSPHIVGSATRHPNRNQCTPTIHSFIKEPGRMEPEATRHSRGQEGEAGEGV
jgi:hypothetical protein